MKVAANHQSESLTQIANFPIQIATGSTLHSAAVPLKDEPSLAMHYMMVLRRRVCWDVSRVLGKKGNTLEARIAIVYNRVTLIVAFPPSLTSSRIISS